MRTPDLLGRRATLRVRRIDPRGAFLAVDAQDETPGAAVVLLPRGEVPEGIAVGQDVPVFVYLDSEDRPIATMKEPMLVRGEVRFLAVTAIVPFGGFVDWGLGKELLVPHGEQIRDLRIGDRHPIGLILDASGRLCGTMKITEMLATKGPWPEETWVQGEAWRNEPELGLFVILDRKVVALLPATEPHRLQRGESASFRVAFVLPDNKIELSLRGHAHEELDTDAAKVLQLLSLPGAPPITEKADPDEVRERFGLSKKAFKRAVGRLMKQNDVEAGPTGELIVRRRG